MARRKSAQAANQGVQKRDVNAAVRAIAALDLAIAGNDWQTIADLANYSNPGSAYKAVQRELRRRIDTRVDTLRELQLARLMRLRSVYYPKALAGDGWSLDRCLRLDERESALMGLDVTRDAMVAATPYTKRIVIEDASDGVTQQPPSALAAASAAESEALV